MAQSYKVYFAGRPVIFTQADEAVESANAIVSRGKTDILLIEEAIQRGARIIHVLCHDVQSSWTQFASHFEFVQAAGGLVVNTDHKLLFIYRMDKWDLPKGKVETEETVREGAIREVEEECSIDQLLLDRELCETWHTYVQGGVPMIKSTRWFTMKYLGTAIPKPQLQEGITEVIWLGLDELEMVRKNTYPSVLDVLEAYKSFTAVG
jgi:ADP-ribose pyrophosphatase YjhB (NUDIX family)